MAKNNGKEAEKAFADYWEKRGHLERLRDKQDLVGLNGGRNIADFKKPSDFIVSSKTDPMHYAEVKSVLKGLAFPFSYIKDGQSKAALLASSRGDGNYYFYIFSYELSQWFIMSCHQYRSVLEEGRRSVKFEELEQWHK